MSDIFRDYSFGGWLKHYRIEKQITLRNMAKTLSVDAGNYCKIERSSLPPPSTKTLVLALVEPLSLTAPQQEFMLSLALEARLAKTREDFKK